jgi:hypothetical protein
MGYSIFIELYSLGGVVYTDMMYSLLRIGGEVISMPGTSSDGGAVPSLCLQEQSMTISINEILSSAILLIRNN